MAIHGKSKPMTSSGKSTAMTRRDLLRLACAAAALYGKGALTAANARVGMGGKLPIGMNMAAIADWEPGYPFLNLMWGARIWLTKNLNGSGPWDTGLTGAMEMDGDGYPLEIPFRADGASVPQIAFTLLPSVLKAGRYVILYDGEGEIRTSGGTRILNAEPGRIEIYMKHGGADHLEVIKIRRSRRGDHVRNIRVLPIEHENADLDANPFRQEALEFCRPWHCLRFMDWQGANNSIDRAWADRKRPSFYTQVGTSGDALGIFGPPVPDWRRKWASGVAIEHCVKLANLTATDAWFCMPHLADDDYIREMAKLVSEQLDPELKVYIEFSNEIWNWQFQQAQWMIRSELAGDLVAAAGGRLPWNGGARPARFENGIVAEGAGEGADHPERIGALFRRCFGIWEDVFSGEDRKRLVRVCAVQSGWPDTARRTLEWVMAHGGCDALSPAGYFGPDEEIYAQWGARGADLTAEDVIAAMPGAVENHARELAENAGYAREAGVRLITYEGGQHIQPEGQQDTPYNAALGESQRHPGMYDLYRRLIGLYAEAGCDLFCVLSSVGAQGTRWGSWGHIEHYGQDPGEMPKYRAILDANAARAEGG